MWLISDIFCLLKCKNNGGQLTYNEISSITFEKKKFY